MRTMMRKRILTLAVWVMAASPLYGANPQEVNPAGYKILLFLALLLLLLFFPGRKLWRQLFSFGSPRLHLRMRSEGKGRSIVYVVTLTNRSRNPIELDAPYLRFSPRLSRAGSRTFRVRAQGGTSLFPLALWPGTSYAFRVPVSPFLDNAEGGVRFSRLTVEARTPDGKHLASATRRCPGR